MGFYENLSGNGVFFFWVAVALACFLVGLSVFLLFKNKKLSALLKREEEKQIALPIVKKEEVKEEKKEEPKVEKKEEKEEIPKKEEEIVKIDIVDEKKETPIIKEMPVLEKPKEVKVEKHEEKLVFADDVRKSNGGETPRAYQKNVLRELSKKMPTSPIHIARDDYEDVSTMSVSSDLDYDLDGLDLREDSVSPLEDMEDVYEANESMKFAGEALSKMEEEQKPSNIELNDFEKKQEEEAIISYDELQQVKDKIYNLTEDEETDEFIDELKEFRLDLK